VSGTNSGLVLSRHLYLLAFFITPIVFLYKFFMPLTELSREKYITEAQVRDINAFLSHQWIQRAWTWQELVLSRKAVIICGDRALSWHRFTFALSVLDLCCNNPGVEATTQDPFDADSMVGLLAIQSRAYRRTKKDFSKEYRLENLKAWCFLSECWLRVGRSSRPRKDGKKSFLEWHYMIYSTLTLSIVVYFSWSIISILGLIGGLFIFPVRPLIPIIYVVLLGPVHSWCAWFSIRVMHALQKNMKMYSRLPMGFAVIPILRARKATDPRDLCYGLYGVLEVEGLTHLAEPDYHKDPRTVFREFLLDLLQWENAALVLLLDCCSFEEPSWAPDWRVATRQSWLDEKYFYGISTVSATPRSLPYFESTDDGRCLFVYGVEANDAGVIWASDLAAERDWGEECLNTILDWIRTGLRERLGTIDTVPVREQVRIFEALEAILFRDRNLISSPRAHNAQKALAHLSSGFKTWFTLVEPYVTSGAANPEHDSGTAERESTISCYEKIVASQRALEYHVKICKQIAGKRRLFLFRGSKSVDFGTGSQAVEAGDLVYLISGLPVPMLLRSTGAARETVRNGKMKLVEGFTVVGPAFIPSMMKGEVWPSDDMWLKGKWKQPLAKDRLKEICLV
jgi:hypothetical protein